MQIRETGTAASVYRWSRKVWESFGGPSDYGSNRTNLCTFVRTVIVWVPLALAINAATISAVAYTAFLFLQVAWANLDTVGILGLIILAALLVLAMIVGIAVGGGAVTKALARSEVVSVGVEYIRAKKAGICPQVEIVP